MAKSSFLTSGEVLHFGYIRFTVNGVGNLQNQFNSLNPAISAVNPSVPMQLMTDIEMIMPTNFMNQRGQVYGFVTNLNEDFMVSRIVVWVKPEAFSQPM